MVFLKDVRLVFTHKLRRSGMNRSTKGKNPLSDCIGSEKWFVYHNGKSIPNLLGKTPLTAVNLAIVCRTILAPTSLIPARAAKELLKVVPSRSLSFLPEI